MNKIIALPIMANPRTGGWPTYTAHLAHGLIGAGFEPVIFRIGKRSESKPRSFGRGLEYWNISLPELLKMVGSVPTIITAVGKHHRDEAITLIAEGAGVVIHDPTELDGKMIEAIKTTRVFTIRPVISATLEGLGVRNNYLPHPYRRVNPVAGERVTRAVSLSRVDFDKNTHTIVEANQILEPDSQVKIYGSLNNRYANFKLEKVDPDWERNYLGGWPANSDISVPVRIAKSADMVIDLSTIKGDGGGTQYSFLEVFDAEQPLVIHSGWVTGNPEYDEILPAVYRAVGSAEELAEAVMSEVTFDKSAGLDILKKHDATAVGSLLIEHLSDD